MPDCFNCTEMPPGYNCPYCGRNDGTSDFTYQFFMVDVRIVATEPVEYYRHGPRKGQPKETPGELVLYESPTHVYDATIQGIRNVGACKKIVRESFARLIATLETAGYTDIRLVVSAVGGSYKPLP